MKRRVRQLGALAGGAAVLAIAACGAPATHTVVTGNEPVSPSPTASAAPSAAASAPVVAVPPALPATVVQALTSGRRASITVVPAPSSGLGQPLRSQAAALRTAVAQEPPGSRILAMSLARVKGFGFGSDMATSQLVWLVSMDPYGGAYGAGGPACGRLTFVVEFIDPGTSQWLTTTSGRQAGMTPLPALGPTPSPVQPSPSCGVSIPRVHEGTPAAN